MADKFGFGAVSPILKSLGHYPGQQYSTLATRIVVPGLETTNDYANYVFTFGEIVKFSYREGVYIVRPIADGDTTSASTAVIMRDVVGGTSYNEDIIVGPKRTVPFSLFVLNKEQYGAIAVVCSGTASVAVGGTPYIGLGTGTTVAGTVYGAAQGAAGIDTLALTGFEFKTLPYEPSSTSAKAVIIGRAV